MDLTLLSLSIKVFEFEFEFRPASQKNSEPPNHQIDRLLAPPTPSYSVLAEPPR